MNAELWTDILLYTLAARGVLALLWERLPWWPKEPEKFLISDLCVGAHCGLCGAWMAEEIVPKYWAWSLCDEH